MIREDLECIVGALIDGPITPIVYRLVKDSPYKEELREILGGSKGASNKDKNITSNNESSGRVSFEEWLTKNGQPVPL